MKKPPQLPGVLLLQTWLKRQKITVNAFAITHGIDQRMLSRILRGDRQRISVAMASRIEAATDGRIQMKEWIPKRSP